MGIDRVKIIKTKIPSSKGKLSAEIYYSKEKTKKLAVLLAGYLDTKDYAHLVGLSKELNDKDYTVVRFDPTGTWESEGDISDYTTTQYLEDIRHVINFMLNEADYSYILLGGHSRGGQLSILYAARDPKVSLVLSIMPSSNRTTKMGSRYLEWQAKGFNISYRDLPNDRSKKKEFRVPYSHSIDKDKYSVVEDVAKVKVPIVFIAGELDTECPVEIVKEIYDNANEPKRFVIMKEINHDYRLNMEKVIIVDREIIKLIDLVDQIETYKKKLKEEEFVHIYDWTDEPHTKYPSHAHKGKVSFYVVEGSISMTVGGKNVLLKKGDYYQVPVGVEHTAEIGSNGCTFVVGEEIEGDS